MAEFTSRPYRLGDAPALTAVYNAIEQHAGGHPGYTDDETAAIITSIVADPETDTRLVFAPGGELAAAGIVATPPPNGFRIDAHGGVGPEWRGRGLGREVLGWQVERARAIHRAAGSPEGWVFETNALVTDESAVRLFERIGAKPSRYYFEMVAPAKADPRPLPEGLRAQPYEPRFEQALYEAHCEAFSDHWGYQTRTFDQWTGFTVRSETFRPDLSRLAFDGDDLAAYVLSYDDADPGRVYVGHVGTRRPWRRRGMAGALLSTVLSESAAQGKSHAYLWVDADSPTGAVGVYEGAGFATATRSVEYRLGL